MSLHFRVNDEYQTNRVSVVTSLKRQRVPVRYVTLFSVLAAVTVWALIRYRPLEVEIEKLAGRINELDPSGIQLSQAYMNSHYDQQYIYFVMRSCRVADDIPRFDCSRVVVQKKGRDGSLFYVPQGDHKLVVRASWQKREKGVKAIDVLQKEYPEANKKTWAIKLQGDSGYFCNWLSEDDPGTIGWRLTSNNDKFEPVSHDLPLIDFAQTDISWTNGGTEMRFPNALMGDDHSDRPSASVNFGHWDRIGENDNETWQVRFAAEIVSDTPAVICAQSTEWYEGTNERKVIGEYVGDGQFLFLAQ